MALPLSAEAADYAWPVVRVIDGDTVVVDASADLPPELAELRVRLRNVDTPETGHRAGCDAEREAAARATTFVGELLDAAVSAVVHDPEWGKWGGRVVADVVLDDEYSLAELVVDYGHGRPYDSGKRAGWCDQAPADTAAERTDCAAIADDDERLACYDRAPRAAAVETVPPDLAGEFARYVIEPCFTTIVREGLVDAQLVAGLGEQEAVARMKSIAGPKIAALAPDLERTVAGRPRALRHKFYDAFKAICLDDFRRGVPPERWCRTAPAWECAYSLLKEFEAGRE